MELDKTVAFILGAITVMVCTVVVSIAYNNVTTSLAQIEAVTRMVEAGADPVGASCAMSTGTYASDRCAVVAMRGH